MSESNNTGETILAFILGGIMGAALGLLLAPASGDDTREKIADWAKKEKKKGSEYWKDAKEAISHKTDQIKSALS